jgi:hypothetical protein
MKTDLGATLWKIEGLTAKMELYLKQIEKQVDKLEKKLNKITKGA